MAIDEILREATYWSNVAKGEGCWLWKGRLRHGEGYFVFRTTHTTVLRYAWRLSRGSKPKHRIRRTCGTALCVHPDHLELAQTHPEATPRIPVAADADWRWEHWARKLARLIEDGVTVNDLSSAARGRLSPSRLINAVAWLQNQGHLVFHDNGLAWTAEGELWRKAG